MTYLAPAAVLAAGGIVIWAVAAGDAFRLRVALAAWGLRAALALGAFALAALAPGPLAPLLTEPYEGYRFWIFALDAPSYHANASNAVVAWRESLEFPAGTGLEFQIFTALVYRVLGPHPLNVVLLNALFGGLTVVLGYGIARRLAGDVAGRIAAVAIAFWPSALLWSSQLLKDPFCLFLIMAVLDLTMRCTDAIQVRKRVGVSAVARLALLLGVLFLTALFLHRFRHHVAFVLFPAPALILVHGVIRRGFAGWWRAGAAAAVLLVLLLTGAVSRRVDLYAMFAPPHPEAGRVNRGVAFQNAGDLDAAEAEYRRALALRNDYPPAMRNLASVAILRGDEYLTRFLLGGYVKRVPDDAEARALLEALHDAALRRAALKPRPDARAPVNLPSRALAPSVVAVSPTPLRFTGPNSDLATGNRVQWPHENLVLAINQIRINSLMSGGHSNLDPDVRFNGLLDVVRYLPRALSNVLLAPYPSQWFDVRGGTGAAKALSLIEALLMYVLVGPLIVGAVVVARRGTADGLYLVGYLVAAALLLGLGLSNVGTLFRLRLEVLTPFFCMLGPGLVAMLRLVSRPTHEQVVASAARADSP